MEGIEKTSVPDGRAAKMDVLPGVYLWYLPRLWTQIYCPLKSYAEMYLLKSVCLPRRGVLVGMKRDDRLERTQV